MATKFFIKFLTCVPKQLNKLHGLCEKQFIIPERPHNLTSPNLLHPTNIPACTLILTSWNGGHLKVVKTTTGHHNVFPVEMIQPSLCRKKRTLESCFLYDNQPSLQAKHWQSDTVMSPRLKGSYIWQFIVDKPLRHVFQGHQEHQDVPKTNQENYNSWNLFSNHTCNMYVMSFFCVPLALKGKYHANLRSFQNPKMFVCQQKQRKNWQVCYKLSPQCNKTVD